MRWGVPKRSLGWTVRTDKLDHSCTPCKTNTWKECSENSIYMPNTCVHASDWNYLSAHIQEMGLGWLCICPTGMLSSCCMCCTTLMMMLDKFIKYNKNKACQWVKTNEIGPTGRWIITMKQESGPHHRKSFLCWDFFACGQVYSDRQ